MKRNIGRISILAVCFFAFGAVAVHSRGNAAAKESDEDLLLRLDREFDQATATNGVEAWVSYFSENGSMVPQNRPPITGHDAIRKAMTPAFADPNFSLHWKPRRAEILIPGDLGYTTGAYERKAMNNEGKLITGHGTYVSIWRRQADGSWKIILDTGHEEHDPAEER